MRFPIQNSRFRCHLMATHGVFVGVHVTIRLNGKSNLCGFVDLGPTVQVANTPPLDRACGGA